MTIIISDPIQDVISDPVQDVIGGLAVFTDNFNRPDEGLSASPDWTLIGGNPESINVVSNQLDIITTDKAIYLCPDLGSVNHYSQANILSSPASAFDLVIRATDDNNFIASRYNGGIGRWQVFTKIGGALTNIGQFVQVFVSGESVRLYAVGNDVFLDVNGVNVLGPLNTTAFNTITRMGIKSGGTIVSGWIDNYEAGVL